MTPAAMTPAAKAVRKTPTASSPAGATAIPDHRRGVRAPAAPRSPRRVSGPMGGRASAVTAPAPRPTTTPRPTRTPRPAPAPRRVSRRSPAIRAPLGARVLAHLRALPDHQLLDKLIRGRAWIPVLGVMLAGIVAMQVEVLKLGASMGRAIERGTALQSTNELLRASVATLADDQRIERIMASRGMVMPAAAGVGFLSARSGSDPHQAISNIHPPSATSFQSAALQNSGTGASSAGALTPATGVSTTGPTGVSTTGATGGPATGATGASATATTGPPAGAATSVSQTAATGAALPISPASAQSSGSGATASASGGAAIPSGN